MTITLMVPWLSISTNSLCNFTLFESRYPTSQRFSNGSQFEAEVMMNRYVSQSRGLSLSGLLFFVIFGGRIVIGVALINICKASVGH